METAIYFVIGLSCILFFFVIVLAIVFLWTRSKPRHNSRSPPSTVASSSRSRMAARWAHMQQGSLKPSDMGQQSPDPKYEDVEEVLGSNPNGDENSAFPDEFGIGGGISSSRNRRGSLTASSAAGSALVGAGPNGTRTFLKGWFGLDEPNSAGFNVAPEVGEKGLGDTLPMRKPGGVTSSAASDYVPHHRVPTQEESDDVDWETASAHEQTV
ncbi:hypothetical protein DFH28DRAFT_905447 [Melampsora americana]|nr:hypothetical protein DFH28DRAFT_905447 [Melampsora americana]